MGSLIDFYNDCEILDVNYYYDDTIKVFDLLSKYYTEEPVLYLLLMILENKINANTNDISELTNDHYESINYLMKNRKQFEDQRIYRLSIKINDLLEQEKNFKMKKYDLLDFRVQLSEQEKQRLDSG